jgi:amicyanin
MTRHRRSLLLVIGGLLVALAAACGSSGSGGGASTAPTGPNTISIKNFMFSPSTLTVKAGTKVTFVNDDSTPHTATGSGSSAMINSGNLNQGQTYSVTFSKPGTYQYTCTIHPYMKGTIKVT